MQMTFVDWSIVIVAVAGLTSFTLVAMKYMRGVSDFLSANRSAGRYMLMLARGMSNAGAISIVAMCEQYYRAGFPPIWWQWMLIPAAVVVSLSGWVFYRYRETRCMTLAQFFEVRYSRRFRIFSGIIVFISGVANFGIFPYVASNFFVYFCGFPETLSALGMTIPTYWPIMLVTLGLALTYTCLGGQITVMITDCAQGIFTAIMFLVLAVFLLSSFSWNNITETMTKTPVIATIEDARMDVINRATAYEKVLKNYAKSEGVDISDDEVIAAERALSARIDSDVKKYVYSAEEELSNTYDSTVAVAWTGNSDALDVETSHEPVLSVVLKTQAYEEVLKNRLRERGKPEHVLDEQGQYPRKEFIGSAIRLTSFAQAEVLKAQSSKKSMLNPFDTGRVKDFSMWFFLIMLFNVFYQAMAWQGSQAYNSSGTSPHEQKMGFIIDVWRVMLYIATVLLIALCASTFLNHPAYSAQAAGAHQAIANLKSTGMTKLAIQQRVPMAISYMLPMGLRGLFCFLMICCLVTTQDTYLHSWGSILIQDVIIPLRKKILSPKQHIRYLRVAIVGVALFAFLYGCIYTPSEFIIMYMVITGAIIAGISPAIICGMYWKKGSTLGAWFSTVVGAFGAISMWSIRQFADPIKAGFDSQTVTNAVNWINDWNSMYQAFFISLACVSVYALMSLIQNKVFNLNKMLHRGEYDVSDDHKKADTAPTSKFWRLLNITDEFTFTDRILAVGLVCWNACWVTVFVVVLICHWGDWVPESFWYSFWRFWVLLQIGIGVPTTVWFTIGGFKDIRAMMKRLATLHRDDTDDGRVIHSDDNAGNAEDDSSVA